MRVYFDGDRGRLGRGERPYSALATQVYEFVCVSPSTDYFLLSHSRAVTAR